MCPPSSGVVRDLAGRRAIWPHPRGYQATKGERMRERATAYGVSGTVLRRLSEWNEANPEARVVSLYVGFDGGDLATVDARASLVNSLLSEARQQAGDDDA